MDLGRMKEKQFKSGFATLIGRPNVGKSSLLNRIIGQKITITSDKPQTTRTQLRGILTQPGYQIVWIDTPGLHRPLHQLGTEMVKTAQAALRSGDLAVWVLDASQGLTPADLKVAEELRAANLPVLPVWNKMDLVHDEQLPELPGFAAPLRVSARDGGGLPQLLAAVAEALPDGPPFYPPEMVTDHPERFIAAEFIREQVLNHTQEEVPHSVAVQVDEFKERDNGLIYIDAVIYVERDSQKGILIGAGGERLKQIGQAARADIQELLDAKVFLNLWVKVRDKWRNNRSALRDFGYWEQERRD
ncbi:GTP-binding protein Era [Hydrogenispora ethanolica]|uniref:GTPase Era n=2 Tax=Hydrogenispora ethanolica TaxID=1082276 RepID=A0A4R1RH92_HYDET|nr:GTP-binding protein Era [Hydrogenispora ethanolica]